MKVTISGPDFGNYVDSVASGFEQNGWQAARMPYFNPADTPMLRLLWRVLPDLGFDYFPRMEMRNLSARLISASRSSSLLFIIKSDRIPLDMFGEIVHKAGCPVVLWYMDSCENVADCYERARLASFLFFFDKTDELVLKEKGIRAAHMDVAADTRWYSQLGLNPRYDVSFIGTFYQDRLEFLDEVARRLDGHKVRVEGQYISVRKPWRMLEFRRKYPHLFRVLSNVQMASVRHINKLNNLSRICLNSIRGGSKDGPNPRLFELCASGSFQLVRYLPAIDRCYEVGKEIEAFRTTEEAIDKMKYYLARENERNAIAIAGLKRTLACHTIKIRTRQMQDILAGSGII